MSGVTAQQREYREVYLKSPHWKEIRLQALERAKGRCQFCNNSKSLDVHHRVYDLGNEDLADLTVLCRGCHDHFHSKLKPTRAKKAKQGKKKKVKRKLFQQQKAPGKSLVVFGCMQRAGRPLFAKEIVLLTGFSGGQVNGCLGALNLSKDVYRIKGKEEPFRGRWMVRQDGS